MLGRAECFGVGTLSSSDDNFLVLVVKQKKSKVNVSVEHPAGFNFRTLVMSTALLKCVCMY